MREEFRKLYTGGSGGILLVLLLALYLVGMLFSPFGNARTASVYQAVYRAAANRSVESVMQTAYQYEKGSKEYAAIEQVGKELEEIRKYETDIEQIGQQAKTMQLFFPASSFAARNAQKTAQDFEKREGISLPEIPSLGITAALSQMHGKVILTVIIVFLCAQYVIREKELGTWEVTGTTAVGRRNLITRRLGVICVQVSACYLFLILITALYYGYFYGWGALSYPVQCLYGMKSCVFSISVLEAVVLILLFEWVALIAVTFLVYALCLYTAHSVLYFLGIFSFAGIEVFLYRSISDSSVFEPLKYINVCALLNPKILLLEYHNCNLLGYPVATWILNFILLAVSILFNTFLIQKGWKQMQKQIKKPIAIRFLKKEKPIRRHRLVVWECYKHLYLKRTVVLLAAFLLFLAVTYHPSRTYYKDIDEYYYKNYIKAWEGYLTEKTASEIQTEYARFSHILKKIQKNGELEEQALSLYAKELDGQNAFFRVYDQYTWAKEDPQNRQLVYESGYRWLLGEEGKDRTRLLFFECLLFVLLFCADLFVEETTTGVKELLHATVQGNKQLARTKYKIAMVFYTAAFFLIFGLRLLAIGQVYGYPSLLVDAESLSFCDHVHVWMPIWMLLALVHTAYYIAGFVYVTGCLFISKKSRSYVTACLGCLLLGGIVFGLFWVAGAITL